MGASPDCPLFADAYTGPGSSVFKLAWRGPKRSFGYRTPAAAAREQRPGTALGRARSRLHAWLDLPLWPTRPHSPLPRPSGAFQRGASDVSRNYTGGVTSNHVMLCRCAEVHSRTNSRVAINRGPSRPSAAVIFAWIVPIHPLLVETVILRCAFPRSISIRSRQPGRCRTRLRLPPISRNKRTSTVLQAFLGALPAIAALLIQRRRLDPDRLPSHQSRLLPTASAHSGTPQSRVSGIDPPPRARQGGVIRGRLARSSKSRNARRSSNPLTRHAMARSEFSPSGPEVPNETASGSTVRGVADSVRPIPSA